MNSFREEILSQLKTDLFNITIANGYDITIKEVFPKEITLADIQKFPAVYFNFGNEYSSNTEESYYNEKLELDLNLVVYIKTNTDIKKDALITTEAEKVIKSISKFIYKDQSIEKSKSCRFKTIQTDDSFLEGVFIEQKNPYLDHTNNVGAIQFIIKIIYRHIY